MPLAPRGLAIVLALPIPLGNMLPALAISLMALGLQPGDRVAVQVDKSAEALILWSPCHCGEVNGAPGVLAGSAVALVAICRISSKWPRLSRRTAASR